MFRFKLIPAMLALVAGAACGGNEDGPKTVGGDGDDAVGPIRTDDDGSSDESGPNPSQKPPAKPPVSGVDASVPKDICSSLRVDTERERPDILFVVDRSESMINNPEHVDRWTPAAKAIRAVAEANADKMSFGLMIFPGSLPVMGKHLGDLQCAPGTVEIPIGPGPMTSGLVGDYLASLYPATTMERKLVPTTPTAVSLKNAREYLEGRMQVVDGAIPPPAYVVLVTDGEPNCNNNQNSDETGQVDASVAEIQKMAKVGVKTFVVGFTNAMTPPKFTGALDKMAAAGGTDRTTHLSVGGDEKSLVDALTEVTGKAASCDFRLDQAPKDPAFVGVEVAGRAVGFDPKDGWVLNESGTGLSLTGPACERLRKSSESQIKVTVECEPIVVQ